MSVLSVIQDHCKMHAISVPSSAVGSTDTGAIQLLAILKEVLEEIVTESKFQVIVQQATFTTAIAEDQGAMTTLAPFGYQFALFETFFDRTQMRPLFGPLDESEWQAAKALPTTGTFYKFRIRQNRLLLNPAPTVTTTTIAFEYMSSYCVTSSIGTLKAAITDDTDLFVFPENIIRKGMMYRWKQIKGLPYQADETKFYYMLNSYIAKDKVKRRINVSGEPGDIRPGIWIPSNSWNV